VAPLSPARERRQRERVAEEKPADRAIDRERLIAKRAQIGDCDYFSVLGVAREASDHEIRRAYDRLRADFARDRFGDPVIREMGDALDEIQEVLDEAYRVLMDQTLRSAYVSRLPE
jgi:preprotein translocase subunit Sec63